MTEKKFYEPDDSFRRAGISKTWDFKAEGSGAVLFGVFMYKEESVGTNNSNLYTFMQHKDDKFNSPIEAISVWGNTLLDARFKNFQVGELVVLVYLGEEPSEKRKGAKYHNFEVYHKPAPLRNDANETYNGDLAMEYA